MMSNILVRSLIGDNFEYKLIYDYFTENEILKYKDQVMSRYSRLTKKWDIVLNTEWIIRNYLAIKMILASSVMFTTLEYANYKNLRIVEPYLIYYGLLNTCRALIFTDPDASWNDGTMIRMRHSQIINISSNCISKVNSEVGREIKSKILLAKDFREFFSYKFPAKGLYNFNKELIVTFDEAIKLAALICELAQFNSEQLQKSLDKHGSTEDYLLDIKILENGFFYKSKSYSIIDDEDMYRLGYIYRKQKRPFNLYWTMTEGMVEDFFGAWCPENDESHVYNPDENWSIIFPMP